MEAKPKQMYKNWSIAIKDYTEEDKEWFKEMYQNNIFSYFIFGRRSWNEEVPCLHGYIQFTEPKRLTAVKKLHQIGHWEPAKYTAKQTKQIYSTYAKVQTLGTILTQAGRQKKGLDSKVSKHEQSSTTGGSLLPNWGLILEFRENGNKW